MSRRHPQNNAGLVQALVEANVEFIVIGGVAAIRPDLKLLDEPLERLMTFRLLLIETTLGRLDVLPRVEPIGDYDTLQAVEMTLAGHMVRVIERRQLITVKESLSRPKDREVALELRAIDERERGGR